MKHKNSLLTLTLICLAGIFSLLSAQTTFTEYKGKIVDQANNNPLSYANILVDNTNIATVTNAEGEFSLKISPQQLPARITIRHLGYSSRTLTLDELTAANGRVALRQVTFQLPEVDVLMVNGEALVRAMLERAHENYPSNELFMTAFYRESIQRNRNYVSLSEAVIDIHKHPHTSYRNDMARLYRSRKQTDYSRLDTLVFKLMGGPYNNLYLDVIKHPNIVFSDNIFGNYNFKFNSVEWLDDRMIYVVDFNHLQHPKEVLYNGKLYIDASTMALKSAVFDMNLTNSEEAVKMFLKKKPLHAKVTPTEASYRIDYIENNGKWYYAYSRIEIGMKINWRRKLFNTNYSATIEMAITDREHSSDNQAIRFRDRLRSDVVISDAAEGFSDPDFWGPYNVIEPEKPIEAAIRKIQRLNER